MTSTRRQLLRQGRGAGFLAVLDAGSDSAADVLDCVLHDPRWDRQVEAREDYYAQLLLASGVDIEPLHRFVMQQLEGDESDYWLPMGVLAELCRRGDTRASRALADVVGSGERWRASLDALEGTGGFELIDRVVDDAAVRALTARIGSDELAAAVNDISAPWQRWAERVPALRFVVTHGGQGSREARPGSVPAAWIAPKLRRPNVPLDLGVQPTPALLALCSTPGLGSALSAELARRTDVASAKLIEAAAESGPVEQRHVALLVLAKQGRTEFVTEAFDFLRQESLLDPSERKEHRTRKAFLRYLEALPPAHTLPLARRWFTEPWPLSLAAEGILEQHATASDRPLLESAGAAALERADVHRLCSIVDALNVAGPSESLSFLSDVYERADYSYLRRSVVAALCRCRPDARTERYLTEALWDSEAESRQLACQASAGSNLERVRRLRQLSSDVYEDDDVRAAAAGALSARTRE